MSATIINGIQYAANLRARIAEQICEFKQQHGINPGLAVVLVGKDPASASYVRSKNKQAQAVGINSSVYSLPATISQRDLLELINKLNMDSAVHGILVQLPLPIDFNINAVINTIDPDKDVDGFHPINVGKLVIGNDDGLVPCTAFGCLSLLRHQLGELEGQKALIVGRSNIVGKPMAALLLAENCTVTIAHSSTRNLAAECLRADILIVAIGRPHFIPGNWIKPGATVIDVGINRLNEGTDNARLVGDIDYDGACTIAGAITPVPGGVGPVTVACLLHNTLIAAQRLHSIKTHSAN